MTIIAKQRLLRAKNIASFSNQVTLPDFALPSDIAVLNQQYVAGIITFEEKATLLQGKYGLPVAEQLSREEAIRQATANIALEGFVLDPVVELLNERYAAGEIDLEDKLRLIKNFYGAK